MVEETKKESRLMQHTLKNHPECCLHCNRKCKINDWVSGARAELREMLKGRDGNPIFYVPSDDIINELLGEQ